MSPVTAPLAMPYPGLRPFEAEDQPLFFGREPQVSAMLRQLEDDRFVAVVGSSGSGKSSLVRAGLLPAVHEGFLLGTTDWLTIIIKPGHLPYHRLVRALSRVPSVAPADRVVLADDHPLSADEAATLVKLRRTDRGLLTVLDELAISPESRVIVVVDQFEELFAFRRAGANRDSVASRDEAAAFVGMLLRSASEPAGRVWAILTMRSDFIGDCEAFLGLPEQISRSQFLVPRLDRSQMEEAITRPAAVEEGAFKPFTFEDGLVNRIINDAGDRPDQLPLMQHALMRTWKHAVARGGPDAPVIVTAEDYEAAGGIEMALSLHADAAWDEIKDDPKKADRGRRLFLLLCDVTPDGQITRRRPRVAEIQAATGASLAELEEVVRVFQQDDRNFLLPSPPLTAESYLDISHEALLRQWRLFAGTWEEQERHDAGELRRLAELASLRAQGQGAGLLPGQDLERIARWKRRVSAEWARRYITRDAWEAVLGFVTESRRRQLLVRAGIIAGAIVLVCALFATMKASSAKEESEKTMAQAYSQFIGSSSEKDMPTTVEREMLWELVELESTSARKAVIDRWFPDAAASATPDAASAIANAAASARALRRHAQGLHTAVRLDEDMQKYSASKAKICADLLAKELEDSAPSDLERLSSSGDALAGLGTQMDSEDAARIAARGGQIMEKALKNSDGADPDRLSKLAEPLAGLAAQTNPEGAARAAQTLVKALEDYQEISPERLTDFASAITALALRVEPVKAGDFAHRLETAMKDVPRIYPICLADLGVALEAFAARMEPKDAAEVATRGAGFLMDRLEDGNLTDDKKLWALGTALAPLAARMEPAAAKSMGVRLANALSKPETSDHRAWSLSSALAALAGRLEPKDAKAIGDLLAPALENSKETSALPLWGLSHALAVVAGRMEPKDANTIGDGLAQALKKPVAISADRLQNLSQALAAAAGPMEANVRKFIGDQLAQEAQDLPATEGDRLASLASALEALAPNIDVTLATGAAKAMATALLAQPIIDERRTLDLASALAALATRMDPKDAAEIAAGCLQTVAKALDNPGELETKKLLLLGRALGRLSSLISNASVARQTRLIALSNLLLSTATLDPPQPSEVEPEERKQLAELYARLGPQELASVLKWPFCVGEAQKMALGALEKKTGGKFDGNIWRFVERAPSLGISDLDVPPERPKVEDALKELTSVATGGEVPRPSGGK